MSNCEIYVESYTGDDCEFFQQRTVKARKPWKCYECENPIAIGETFELVIGKWDGEMRSFKFCLDCQDVAQAVNGGTERSFGSLWDTIDEEMRYIQSPAHCMAKMKRPTAKARFAERFVQVKSERP